MRPIVADVPQAGGSAEAGTRAISAGSPSKRVQSREGLHVGIVGQYQTLRYPSTGDRIIDERQGAPWNPLLAALLILSTSPNTTQLAKSSTYSYAVPNLVQWKTIARCDDPGPGGSSMSVWLAISWSGLSPSHGAFR